MIKTALSVTAIACLMTFGGQVYAQGEGTLQPTPNQIPAPPPISGSDDLGLGLGSDTSSPGESPGSFLDPALSDTEPQLDVFGVTQPAPGVPQRPASDDPAIREALDIPSSLFDEVQKDPFSYLGNVRYEDIYVIQKKYARKKGRFFVSALVGGGNFFSQFTGNWAHGVGAGYYFSDILGWEALQVLLTSAYYTQRTARFLEHFDLRPNAFEYRIFAIFSSALLYSPFYGKFSLLGFRVIHYEFFFLLGPALVIYETVPGFGGVIGMGFRLFINKWTSFSFELRDYLYAGSPPMNIQLATGDTAVFVSSRFFIFLNLTIHFPKFAFLDEV